MDWDEPNPVIPILIRRGDDIQKYTHSGLMAMRSHRQKHSELATRQRIQRIAGNQEKLKGGKEESSLELSEGVWPCLISDF